MKGLGADNEMLIDIICTKSSAYLAQVIQFYPTVASGRALDEGASPLSNAWALGSMSLGRW